MTNKVRNLPYKEFNFAIMTLFNLDYDSHPLNMT